MNEKDFIIEQEPSQFGGTKQVLKKYVGTDAKVYVPAYVDEIGAGAFCDHPTVENVVLPAELSVIGSCAFSGCKNLRAVNIPETVRVIAGSAFSDCENLSSVTLPDRETVFVERTAFFGCTRMTELWQSRGLCPLCGYKLKRQMFKKVCNRCHTNVK